MTIPVEKEKLYTVGFEFCLLQKRDWLLPRGRHAGKRCQRTLELRFFTSL